MSSGNKGGTAYITSLAIEILQGTFYANEQSHGSKQDDVCLHTGGRDSNYDEQRDRGMRSISRCSFARQSRDIKSRKETKL